MAIFNSYVSLPEGISMVHPGHRPSRVASRSQVDDIVEELKTLTLTEVAELVKARCYADEVTMWPWSIGCDRWWTEDMTGLGDLEHEFYDFPYIGNVGIQTD